MPLLQWQNTLAFSSDGNYLASVNNTSPSFTLLNHTTPGTLTLATTYALAGEARGVSFTASGDYIAVAHATSPFFTLLDHTTPGSVSLAATYTLAGTGNAVAFNP
jgi:6-phosphogluconolactonase (cycloisomerase 2 family)